MILKFCLSLTEVLEGRRNKVRGANVSVILHLFILVVISAKVLGGAAYRSRARVDYGIHWIETAEFCEFLQIG